MLTKQSKVKILTALALVLLFIAAIFYLVSSNEEPETVPLVETEITDEEPVATSTNLIIGSSVEGRDIEVSTFGNGSTSLLFVGGVHGGYEWNSILLAYQFIDDLNAKPELVPDNITIHIIPNLNPDGLYEATNLEGKFTRDDIPSRDIHSSGIGRFNANEVDLNRNFDCKWAPTSSWRGNTVSAGTEPFSEPEAMALRDYVYETDPKAVVFWHSQANNVYASECEDGVLPETLDLMSTYAEAGNYGAVPVFDAYPITGDAEGWLASIGIPAVTVELETRTQTEWSRNLAAFMATLELYK
jgi:hypothetical protein